MTHYDRLKRKRLGDILVDEQMSSEQNVISALQIQQNTGQLLSDILIEQREFTEWDLARVIVEQYQAPFIELKSYSLHKELIEEFPAALLNAASMIPLERFGKQVCFACQEVPSEETVKTLREIVPGGVYVYIASAVEIREALHTYAPLEVAEAFIEKADGPPIPVANMEEDQGWKDLFDSANDAIISDLGDEE